MSDLAHFQKTKIPFCVHSSQLTTPHSSYSFSRRVGKRFVLYELLTTLDQLLFETILAHHLSLPISTITIVDISLIYRSFRIGKVKYHKQIFLQESITYRDAPYTKLSSRGTPLPCRHLVVLKTDSVPKADTYSCYTNNGSTWRGQRLGSSCSLSRKM